jgi:hypothetical protein
MNYCDNAANRLDLARPHRGTVCGFNSLGARLRMMRALAPGLMLADSDGERCLISNPIYRAVRNAKAAGDRVRPTHMAKILQSFRDKADLVSVCAAYEDFMPMLDLLWSVRVELWQELTMLWNEARDKDLREFAGMVQHHPLNFLLFMLKNREIDGLKDAVENIKPIKLIGCAKHKWEKEFVQAENILKIGGNTHAVEENDREEEGGIPYCQEGD